MGGGGQDIYLENVQIGDFPEIWMFSLKTINFIIAMIWSRLILHIQDELSIPNHFGYVSSTVVPNVPRRANHAAKSSTLKVHPKYVKLAWPITQCPQRHFLGLWQFRTPESGLPMQYLQQMKVCLSVFYYCWFGSFSKMRRKQKTNFCSDKTFACKQLHRAHLLGCSAQ